MTAGPVFDVAAIKVSQDISGRSLVQAFPGGRLVMRDFSLRGLIQFAWGVRDERILGDFSAAGADHYDIEARAEGSVTVKQMEGPMLQGVLGDRFGLVLHSETRQMPVYELAVAKTGLKMPRTRDGECVPYDANAPAPAAPAPGAVRPVYCGYPSIGAEGTNRTLDGAGVTIAGLAGTLSRLGVDRMIIDKTGLDGTFDVHLSWGIDALADSTAPSVFTALQDQLGLKVESAKGPVDVLVVDHVGRLSPN